MLAFRSMKVRCDKCWFSYEKTRRSVYRVPYTEWDEERKRKFNEYRNKWWKSLPQERRRMLTKNKHVKREYRTKQKLDYREWENLKLYYGNRCLCCLRAEPEIRLTVDHIVPISRGGKHEIANLQPLCLPCNISKFTKTIDFRATLC